MAAISRTTQLQRLIRRIERLIARGTATSSRFTKWRLTIFIAGLLCSITLFRSGWYNSGNLAVAGFIILFLIVAAYHNRLEQRIHRLWRSHDDVDVEHPPQRLLLEVGEHRRGGGSRVVHEDVQRPAARTGATIGAPSP